MTDRMTRSFTNWFVLILFISLCAHVQAGEVRIVTFGDSTTAPRKGVKNVYADRLPSLLAKHGIKAQVINAGVGESHTGRLEDNPKHKRAHALDRFDKTVRAHKPDVVIIQFGINDSWIDHGESEAPSRIDVTHYQRNLTHMVRTLKADGAKVILMTPNALGKRYEAFRHERLIEYADATRGIAKDQKTMLVDIWNQFRNHKPDAWLLDGMHPNDAGHEVIAQYLASAIAAATLVS